MSERLETEPEPLEVHGTAFGIVVGAYENDGFEPMPLAREQMDGLATLLEGFGYSASVVENPSRASIQPTVDAWETHWRAGRTHKPAIVLWSGHGLEADGDLRLILADTGDPSREGHTYATKLLGEAALASGADQVLLLIDTCHSGAGVIDPLQKALTAWAKKNLPGTRTQWLGIIAASQAPEKAAGGGALLDTVARVLRDGPTTREYQSAWSVRNPGITGEALINAVLAEWTETRHRPVPVKAGVPQPIFRNPKWRWNAGEALVEHLVVAAKGGALQEEGWYFNGRRAVLQQIVDWLDEAAPGLFLVTGGAGTGKSAVVGRIATLSDPDQRSDVKKHGALRADDPDPGEHRVDAALHLRGLDVQGTAEAIARKLGLPLPKTPSALIAHLEELRRSAERPLVLVLDGLDEAASGQASAIAEELLPQLSRNVSVLLGSRDRPFRPHSKPQETLKATVERLLGAAARVADLGHQPDTRADITGYLQRRLRAGGVAEAQAEEIASYLAKHAVTGDEGDFLFARLAASATVRALRSEGSSDWRRAVPDSLMDAFDAELASGPVLVRDGEPVPSAARDLLTALAWSVSQGLPTQGVWEAVASAVGAAEVDYGSDDVDWVLAHYGAYIVEDSDGTQAVYRLYHREFVSHLLRVSRRDAGERGDPALSTMRALSDLTLCQTDGGSTPKAANPYLRSTLSAHAALAGGPGVTLLRDLAAANEDEFLPDLALALNELAIRLAETGERQAALAPAQEATNLYRTLTQASPAAYLPNLAMSLNNLANILAETGEQQAALAAYSQAIAALHMHPPAARRIAFEQATFRLRLPDNAPVVQDLVAIVLSAPSIRPDQVTFRARQLLRAHAQANAANSRLVESAWQGSAKSDPPAWLTLSEAVLTMLVEWLDSASWSESRTFWDLHGESLLSSEAALALEELALISAAAEQHLGILQQLSEGNADDVYRPLVLSEVLSRWMESASWEESKSFLELQSADLLNGDAANVLLRLAERQDDAEGLSPDVAVHLALLQLASQDDTATAYACVEDRTALHYRVQRALVEADATALHHCAALEAAVFQDDLAAAVHWLIAAILTDAREPAIPPTPLAELLAESSTEDRNRAASEVAALIGRHSQHAQPLSQLLQSLLAEPANHS